MKKLDKIVKFRIILSSRGLDTCRRAKKVNASDSAETGPHIHIFFWVQYSANFAGEKLYLMF